MGQQLADSFPHYITQERKNKSAKYKALEHIKALREQQLGPCIVRAMLSHIDRDPLQASSFVGKLRKGAGLGKHWP